jgi:hypothetical protein
MQMVRFIYWALMDILGTKVVRELRQSGKGQARRREFASSETLEDISARRTQGRSDVPETLEEQLQQGLEDTFPASDPRAVVSTAIAGRCKEMSVPTRCCGGWGECDSYRLDPSRSNRSSIGSQRQTKLRQAKQCP